MPSGKTHEKLNKLVLIVFIVSIFTLGFYSLHFAMIFALGYLFATFFMGPDLDTNSTVYRRWGYLRFIWYPYRKMFSHRSFFTHGLFIGDVIRILYLSAWLYIIGQIMQRLTSIDFVLKIAENYHMNPFPYYFLVIGIVFASTVHIISDIMGSAWKKLF